MSLLRHSGGLAALSFCFPAVPRDRHHFLPPSNSKKSSKMSVNSINLSEASCGTLSGKSLEENDLDVSEVVYDTLVWSSLNGILMADKTISVRENSLYIHWFLSSMFTIAFLHWSFFLWIRTMVLFQGYL